MAKYEQSREDLLAEATALVERVELALPAESANVVIGFRKTGAASLYFGEDPAYHFNSAGQLRRAYLDGQLLKAEREQLITMARQRDAAEVQLRSRALTAAESSDVLGALLRRVKALERNLADGHFQIVGQVPSDVDIIGRARRFLADLAAGISIAASPRMQ
ncbi:MAG TPA: hypothetical protein VGN12_00040 [Pirellulales bacterium]